MTRDIVDHFDALEAGELISYEALLAACHCDQQRLLMDAPLVVPLAAAHLVLIWREFVDASALAKLLALTE